MRNFPPMKMLTLGLTILVCLVALSANADEGFDRYAIILSKKPFGIPREPVVAPVVAPPTSSPTLAKELRLCSLTEREGRGIRAGIVENKTNKTYILGVGETVNDLTLISADLEREEALLKRGAETATIKIAGGVAAAKPAAAKPAQKTRGVVSSKKYQERRKAVAERRKQRAPPPPAAKPKYTGAALRQHLREYNMEAIRQGLPALPIELSPEQDDQLVLEGYLPPSSDSFSTVNDPLLLQAVERELREQAP